VARASRDISAFNFFASGHGGRLGRYWLGDATVRLLAGLAEAGVHESVDDVGARRRDACEGKDIGAKFARQAPRVNSSISHTGARKSRLAPTLRVLADHTATSGSSRKPLQRQRLRFPVSRHRKTLPSIRRAPFAWHTQRRRHIGVRATQWSPVSAPPHDSPRRRCVGVREPRRSPFGRVIPGGAGRGAYIPPTARVPIQEKLDIDDLSRPTRGCNNTRDVGPPAQRRPDVAPTPARSGLAAPRDAPKARDKSTAITSSVIEMGEDDRTRCRGCDHRPAARRRRSAHQSGQYHRRRASHSL